MKNLTVQKRHHSMQSLQNKDNGNNPGLFKTSIGLALNKNEKSEQHNINSNETILVLNLNESYSFN